MAKTMTASAQTTMTDGQIDNLVDKFRAAVRKHCKEFNSDSVQQVLGVDNLGMELLVPFRSRVEAVSNLIVRRVKVNRLRTPQAALDATGRKQYTDRAVVDAMPKGESEEVDFYFFKPRPVAYVNGLMSDDRLEAEFDFHGLKPDPIAQAAVNEQDPAFADTHPNGTHWKDAQGKWCFLPFHLWHGERLVSCHRLAFDWRDNWVYGGVRK